MPRDVLEKPTSYISTAQHFRREGCMWDCMWESPLSSTAKGNHCEWNEQNIWATYQHHAPRSVWNAHIWEHAVDIFYADLIQNGKLIMNRYNTHQSLNSVLFSDMLHLRLMDWVQRTVRCLPFTWSHLFDTINSLYHPENKHIGPVDVMHDVTGWMYE